MSRLILALALAASTTAAHAQWVDVARSPDSVYQIRAGSAQRATTKAGQPVTAVIGQVRDTAGAITVFRWYVTDAHCDAGMGALVALRATGEHAFDVDWTTGGTSIASTVAGLICALRPEPAGGFRPIGRF